MADSGEFLFGIVEEAVGATRDGLIYVVFHEKGPEATRSVFAATQIVVNF